MLCDQMTAYLSLCMRKDLVFSVKLHLALSSIPLTVSLIPNSGEGSCYCFYCYCCFFVVIDYVVVIIPNISLRLVLGLSLEFYKNLGGGFG